MYEAHFGLREKPFSILPDPDLIYWGPMHRMAMSMLEFGVLNNAGFTVVTGDIGSGKTTLVRCLLRRVSPSMRVGLISNTPRGREELLQWIMLSLDQPFEGNFPTLFKRLRDYLFHQYQSGRRTVIIVDEAQNLDWESLEDLRMLSNINADKHQVLQLILVGQPQLRDLLRSPNLTQFAQRVSSDFHVRPLKPEDVGNYINYRLQAVGASYQIFSPDSCALIAKASGGIPRTINILCDTALVYAYAANEHYVEADVVTQVIDDKREFGVFPLPVTADT
jgi:type II secretory pathway predicted ATPase ExeA